MSDVFVSQSNNGLVGFIKKSGSNLGQSVSVCDEHGRSDNLRSELIVLVITAVQLIKHFLEINRYDQLASAK